MYASSCVTLAGAAHSSIEYSPLLLTESKILRLEAPPRAAPPLGPKLTPQPPTQLVSPESVRLMAGSTPLVSSTVVPLPSLNCHLAMMPVS